MIVSWYDVVMWAIAFLILAVIVLAVRSAQCGDGIAWILGTAFLVLAIALAVGGVQNARNRWQDHLAYQDISAANYTFVYANRVKVELQVDDCLATFDVHKINGVYRPTIQRVNGTLAVLTPRVGAQHVMPQLTEAETRNKPPYIGMPARFGVSRRSSDRQAIF